MRCPKCGYNSFDHLDSCKKCGKDLIEHKQKFGIVSVLFPGQMKPVDQTVTAEDESVVDDVVAAATVTAATAAAAGVATAANDDPEDFQVGETVSAESGDGDDFGFDFMGDSEEEEDLSFDELFEEAPADEDVEETLPSPEEEAAEDAGGEAGDEFAFDSNDEEAAAELEDDFGFDPVDEADDADEADEDTENLAADDFELPPAEEDEFSFETDNVEFEGGEEEDAGTEEDPKSPFDLPESSQQEGAPEETYHLFVADPEPDSIVEADDDLLLAETVVGEEEAPEPKPEPEPNAALVEDIFSDDPELSADVEEPRPEAELPIEPFPEESVFSEELEPEAAVPELAQELEPPAESPQLEPQTTGEDISEKPEFSDAPLAAAAASGAVVSAATAVALETEQDEVVEEVVEEVGRELLPATGNRIAAFCCDLLLLVIVGTSFVIAAEAAISTSSESLLPSVETLIDLSVPYFLVLFSLAFSYFTLFHFLVGQTPGKMLTGLRVETLTGEPLLFSQAFLRSVGGLLQALPAGIGYLVILSSSDRRGWNDRLAGTRLISLKGLAEEG